MSSGWRESSRGDRGAYTSVTQTEDGDAELTAHGKESEDGQMPMMINGQAGQKSPDNPGELSYDGSAPSLEDLKNLPRIADKLPWGAFLVAIVELCERFAYYGLAGPFQNYMANKYDDPNGLPGAIGLKQSGATALSNSFQFWCYLTPIIGAVVADKFLGKYTTIKYFSIVYIIGIFILFLTSLPVSIRNGGAFPGLIAAMAIIGLGTGGIKSNVSPLIAEQVRSTKSFVKVLSNGKRVVVDPEVTIQRIYMIFYMCINIGSISAIATTTLELRVGFWSAYLLPLLMFCVGFFVLVSGKEKYVVRPPHGDVIGDCFKALWIASWNRFDLDKAKPSSQRLGKRRYRISWNDEFIDELKTALLACRMFLFFPIYWVTYSQMLNNFVSQAGQMELHGLPNDILQNIDPITIILLIPLLDRAIYPFMRTRLHLAFTPIMRITWGFIVASLAMAYAAILQSRIYSSPPCYTHPSKCAAANISEDKYKPNAIHVAYQTPAYILIALSEILASITGLELAYAKAPQNMKSLIMSLFLLTSAFGSALGMLVAPSAKDPDLVWLYTGLACAAFAAGVVFYWTFRGMDRREVAREVERAGDEFEMTSRKSDDEEGVGREV